MKRSPWTIPLLLTLITVLCHAESLLTACLRAYGYTRGRTRARAWRITSHLSLTRLLLGARSHWILLARWPVASPRERAEPLAAANREGRGSEPPARTRTRGSAHPELAQGVRSGSAGGVEAPRVHPPAGEVPSPAGAGHSLISASAGSAGCEGGFVGGAKPPGRGARLSELLEQLAESGALDGLAAVDSAVLPRSPVFPRSAAQALASAAATRVTASRELARALEVASHPTSPNTALPESRLADDLASPAELPLRTLQRTYRGFGG